MSLQLLNQQSNVFSGVGPFEVQYVEENIKRDITAEELAQYSHLSLRSLYLLFEKNAKTPPQELHPPEKTRAGLCNVDRPEQPDGKRHGRRAGIRI